MKVQVPEIADRMRRVAQVWNWLPSFRAAAESAHLPSASALLGISSPALSRTLKLVEESLGISLFERVGRRLQLNDSGGVLLAAVRNAMRLVDDAIERIHGGELVGGFRLAAWGSHAIPLVLPAIRSLRTSHPGIVVQLSALEPGLVAAQLREGLLDLAIMDDPPEAPDLLCDLIGALTYAVYAGKTHPLHGLTEPPSEITRHPFVVPVPGIDDRWPAEVPRSVGVRVASLHDAVALCGTGELLAVLPDSVAAASTREPLWRLQGIEIRPEPIYLVYRTPLAPQPRLALFVGALREHAGALAKLGFTTTLPEVEDCAPESERRR